MQKFKVADGGSPTGEAVDRVGLVAGTTYLAKYWNDNFFNIFNAIENAGYSLIDNDLEQFTKAFRGKYNAAYTYNTSAVATQTVSDIVEGSNGMLYQAQTDAVTGDDPVGSITGNWAIYVPEFVARRSKTITHNITIDADYTLTADQNTYGRIKVTDTGVLLTTARNIIVDNIQKRFVFINNTLQSLTVKTSAGTGIQVPAGQTMDLYNDGTNIVEAVSNSTGFKNLLHNPNRILQTRGTTGGRRQVIDASNVQLGGSYVISHGGSATVRIYEATTLGTSDALTTWSELTAGASISGTVVTVTAGKFIKVEFSTTDFSFEQFEKGTIPSSFEQRAQLEPYLCLPYYEKSDGIEYLIVNEASATSVGVQWKEFKVRKRVAPSVTLADITSQGWTIGSLTATSVNKDGFRATDVTATATAGQSGAVIFSWIANAEHFSDTYYEDRWF